MVTINDLEMLGDGSMVADRFGTLWERTSTGWLSVPATTNRLIQTYGPITVVFPEPSRPLVEREGRAAAGEQRKPEWFAAFDEDAKRNSGSKLYAWQPSVSVSKGVSASLDIWFKTEADCEAWIREELGYER